MWHYTIKKNINRTIKVLKKEYMLSQMVVTFKKNTPLQAKMVQGVTFVLKEISV